MESFRNLENSEKSTERRTEVKISPEILHLLDQKVNDYISSFGNIRNLSDDRKNWLEFLSLWLYRLKEEGIDLSDVRICDIFTIFPESLGLEKILYYIKCLQDGIWPFEGDPYNVYKELLSIQDERSETSPSDFEVAVEDFGEGGETDESKIYELLEEVWELYQKGKIDFLDFESRVAELLHWGKEIYLPLRGDSFFNIFPLLFDFPYLFISILNPDVKRKIINEFFLLVRDYILPIVEDFVYYLNSTGNMYHKRIFDILTEYKNEIESEKYILPFEEYYLRIYLEAILKAEDLQKENKDKIDIALVFREFFLNIEKHRIRVRECFIRIIESLIKALGLSKDDINLIDEILTSKIEKLERLKKLVRMIEEKIQNHPLDLKDPQYRYIIKFLKWLILENIWEKFNFTDDFGISNTFINEVISSDYFNHREEILRIFLDLTFLCGLINEENYNNLLEFFKKSLTIIPQNLENIIENYKTAVRHPWELSKYSLFRFMNPLRDNKKF